MSAMRGGLRATAALVALACAGGVYAQSAAAAGSVSPRILSLTSSVRTVPARGGAVKLSARVAGATRCTFTGVGSAFASTARVVSVACASGRATVTVHVVPNALTRAASVRVILTAVPASGRAAQRTITLKQAAAAGSSNTTPPPAAALAIATTTLGGATVGVAYTGSLAATGGTAPYAWAVGTGALPQGIALGQNGTFSGSPVRAGQFAFAATVTDAKGQTATGSFSITVTAVTVRVAQSQQSTNWSGYSLDGGPFTYATGTFNVPTLTNTFGTADDSQWVGVDGDTPGDEDLIQAGVAEDFSSFGGLDIYAWWEILPAAETRIQTISVQPGDSVTVTLRQLSAGSWSISVVDNTSGQSFQTTQSYNGAGSSAEWIVEAPTLGSGRIATLGPYTPNVTFSNMSWTGTGTVFNPISLSQRGGTVSVPSTLSADQTSFTVAYGSAVPPAPVP